MENASKALIMAGGVLIAILLLTLFSYLFTKISSSTASFYDNLEKHEIDEFNQQFLNYEGSGTKVVGKTKDENGNDVNEYNPLVAQDIATLINLAKNAEKNSKIRASVEIKLCGDSTILSRYSSGNEWLSDKVRANPNSNPKYKCTMVQINTDTRLVDKVVIDNF